MADDSVIANSLYKIKVWATTLASNGTAEDLKAAATVAQERIGYALTAGEFLQNGRNSDAYQKLIDANEHLGKILEHIEKGEKVYKDVMALVQIHAAIKVLQDDQVIYKDPQKAAAAFDDLFMGFGKIAKHFPPPFDSTIGELLEQCGTLRFFSNMEQVMAGPNSNLGRAKALLYDTRD
ncbi:MAG TPA: hypothetical protein VNK26_04570 [Pyrinomonadaceae bacterium]|jgi:type I restriction-modification system DNA methylase subunit|nr:hypothetical protein [Pyrinomonadaceae bacterium]